MGLTRAPEQALVEICEGSERRPTLPYGRVLPTTNTHCYLLPTTYYLLPTAYDLLPTTSNVLRPTSYVLRPNIPSASAPNASCQLSLATCCVLPAPAADHVLPLNQRYLLLTYHYLLFLTHLNQTSLLTTYFPQAHPSTCLRKRSTTKTLTTVLTYGLSAASSQCC